MKSKSEFEYEPSDFERESIVLEVPTEILMNSIQTQFDDLFSNRKTDYIQTFITRYEFCRDNMIDDDNDSLAMEHDRFISFMVDMFDEKLDLGFPDIEDVGIEDQHELLHLTYRFFVKNIKKNMVNVMRNYIEIHQSQIESNYSRKKDVTTLNFKNELDDEYDILVLSNLGLIVDDIIEDLKLSADVDDYFNLCVGDEPSLELEFVKDSYDDNKIVGNFVEKYLDTIDDEFETEIQQKVRNLILKKYPKRTVKLIEESIEKLDSEEE